MSLKKAATDTVSFLYLVHSTLLNIIPAKKPNTILVPTLRITLENGAPLLKGENMLSTYETPDIDAFHILVSPNIPPNAIPSKGPKKNAPIITGIGIIVIAKGFIIIYPKDENAKSSSIAAITKNLYQCSGSSFFLIIFPILITSFCPQYTTLKLFFLL